MMILYEVDLTKCDSGLLSGAVHFKLAMLLHKDDFVLYCCYLV